jgi:electron transfer flavoprotein beta subunit
MKILVCIKQVPDMEAKFRIDAQGTWFQEADLAWRMNEYDEYAVEQAVLLKEQLGGAPEITVLSIGPERVKEVIKKALAMGGDRGVHVQDEAVSRRDPRAIAAVIAASARDQGFDVVFTGTQSQDRGSAQVGVLVAERLKVPAVSTIVGFSYEAGTVTARRELEGGLKAVVRVRTPALFTCQLGLNTPRYPTLPNIMKAKKKELTTIPVASLQPPEPLAETVAMNFPERKGSGVVLEGDVGNLADRLIGILKEKTTVLR